MDVDLILLSSCLGLLIVLFDRLVKGGEVRYLVGVGVMSRIWMSGKIGDGLVIILGWCLRCRLMFELICQDFKWISCRWAQLVG